MNEDGIQQLIVAEPGNQVFDRPQFAYRFLCLDQAQTILVSRPARVFDYFNQASAPIVEGLIVPLYDTGHRPLGTIWIVSHDERRFEANDVRIMEQLSVQLVLALKLIRESADQEQLRHAVASKDTLIQEVHHRIKNTIQTAASLLRLQANASHSSEVRTALEEAQGRLTVFTRVHELLYQSADGAQAIGMRSERSENVCRSESASNPSRECIPTA